MLVALLQSDLLLLLKTMLRFRDLEDFKMGTVEKMNNLLMKYD